MPNTKPRVFIASSSESKAFANAVQQNLEDEDFAVATVWSHAFTLGQTVIDELEQALAASDFGVFVFAPDDELKLRDQKLRAARDNVVLELGMFIGRLGKERSFLIRPKGVAMRMPTDLLGVVAGEYEDRPDNRRAGMNGATTEIRTAITRYRKKQARVLNEALDKAVGGALETVCRALSVPLTPERASLRAFIFQKEGNKLVCRYFWDPNPSEEAVGLTKFSIDEKTAERIVVVRCVIDSAPRRTKELDSPLPAALMATMAGGDVEPLPKGFVGVKGKVDPGLRYVLAAPIWKDGEIWGVIDFDASNDKGRKLLKTEVSSSVILRLASHLDQLLP